MEENKNLLMFLPLKSFVHGSFWHKLAELKLDIDCLNDSPKPINAYYTNSNAIGCTMEIDCTSFNQYASSIKLFLVCCTNNLNNIKLFFKDIQPPIDSTFEAPEYCTIKIRSKISKNAINCNCYNRLAMKSGSPSNPVNSCPTQVCCHDLFSYHLPSVNAK